MNLYWVYNQVRRIIQSATKSKKLLAVIRIAVEAFVKETAGKTSIFDENRRNLEDVMIVMFH